MEECVRYWDLGSIYGDELSGSKHVEDIKKIKILM